MNRLRRDAPLVLAVDRHHHDDTGQPLHSFRGLLDHMATLTRNIITLAQATL